MKSKRKTSLVGQKFGRLTVKELAYKKGDSNGQHITKYWKCICDCGNEHIASTSDLRRGNVQSCGCLTRDRLEIYNHSHGLRYHPLYKKWAGLCNRCNNPKNPRYKDYGGRGIYVCKEWLNPLEWSKRDIIEHGNPGFQAFYNWAIANGWQEGLSIDRIDNNGPYAPWNCRFVDDEEQTNNRRSSRFITDNEEKLTYARFEKKYGLKPGYVFSKLDSGWTRSEVVYAATHQDTKFHLQNRNARVNKLTQIVDEEGFGRMIPRIRQED